MKHKERLEHLYHVKRKAYKRAAEELKQRIKAKATTVERYTDRVEYRENRLFQSNQSRFYQGLERKNDEQNVIYLTRTKAESFGLVLERKSLSTTATTIIDRKNRQMLFH